MDSAQIISFAAKAHIPCVYIHHFSNDRLSSYSVRSQLERIQGIAGVSSSYVPSYLRNEFVCVSDGIDTDFYQRKQNLCEEIGNNNFPTIFLPARITPSKGQADLLRVAVELKRLNLNFRICIAGRTDSSEYQDELNKYISANNLETIVEFVGQLNPQELRNMYSNASLVVFPTRHHEGLPRVLLECQSMEVPPIVYNIGGTAEGVLDNNSGFVLPLGNFSQLVSRTKQLILNPILRHNMGQSGRRHILSNFSLDALAIRHEQFYLKAISSC